jgi:hypothetical protein
VTEDEAQALYGLSISLATAPVAPVAAAAMGGGGGAGSMALVLSNGEQLVLAGAGIRALSPAIVVAGQAGLAIAAPMAMTGGEEAQFSIIDWTGYPEGVPRPEGPFKLLEGEDYEAARDAAKAANREIRAKGNLEGLEVHENQPVKFGGDPVDPANKVVMPKELHRGAGSVSSFWTGIQNYLKNFSGWKVPMPPPP